MPRKVFIIVFFIVVLVIFGSASVFLLLKREAPSNISQIPNQSFETSEEQAETQSLRRSNIQVLKGVLEPGLTEVDTLLNEDLERIKALGVNTIHLHADYSYENGEFVLGTPSPAYEHLTQEERVQEQINRIVEAKEKGFAVYLAISFGGGRNQAFNVPLEKFLADATKADLTWAALAEEYKVEFFAPSSEIDFQIFREYYNLEWNNQTKHDEASLIANKHFDQILPAIRKVYDGKVVYPAGLWNPKLGSQGYDIFGVGLNSVGRDVSDFRELTREVYGYAETSAKHQGSGWIIREFWIPIREHGNPMNPGKVLTTSSGTPYAQIQKELFQIAVEEYLAWNGEIKPSGFAFTTYINPVAEVKERPAEELIKTFYNQLK